MLRTVSRRQVLGSSAALGAAAALALASCNTAQVDQALAQAASDAQQIAAALKAILPNIGTVVGISPDKVAKAGQIIADIQSAAAAISSASSASAALPSVQQLEQDVNAVVSVLAGLPLPPPVGPALQAASILLPVIEAAVGIVVPQAPEPGTVDQARGVLQQVIQVGRGQ